MVLTMLALRMAHAHTIADDDYKELVRQMHALPAKVHQHTSAYVSIRQHTSAYVSIRQHTSAGFLQGAGTPDARAARKGTSAYVSMRQHTSAYVSIRQHTSAEDYKELVRQM